MLYVFKVLDTPFVKMGFTDSCPYRRIAVGFWSNLHPAECCGKLGWSNLHLLALFKGTKEEVADRLLGLIETSIVKPGL